MADVDGWLKARCAGADTRTDTTVFEHASFAPPALEPTTPIGKPSVVNVSQLITLDRSLLTERVRTVPAAGMARLDEGLRLVLGL